MLNDPGGLMCCGWFMTPEKCRIGVREREGDVLLSMICIICNKDIVYINIYIYNYIIPSLSHFIHSSHATQ